MPELPEVEGARRLVQRTVVGKRVAKAVVADDESEWFGWRGGGEEQVDGACHHCCVAQPLPPPLASLPPVWHCRCLQTKPTAQLVTQR